MLVTLCQAFLERVKKPLDQFHLVIGQPSGSPHGDLTLSLVSQAAPCLVVGCKGMPLVPKFPRDPLGLPRLCLAESSADAVLGVQAFTPVQRSLATPWRASQAVGSGVSVKNKRNQISKYILLANRFIMQSWEAAKPALQQ